MRKKLETFRYFIPAKNMFLKKGGLARRHELSRRIIIVSSKEGSTYVKQVEQFSRSFLNPNHQEVIRKYGPHLK